MGFVLEQAYWVYVRNSYLERKVWFGLVLSVHPITILSWVMGFGGFGVVVGGVCEILMVWCYELVLKQMGNESVNHKSLSALRLCFLHIKCLIFYLIEL